MLATVRWDDARCSSNMDRASAPSAAVPSVPARANWLHTTKPAVHRLSRAHDPRKPFHGAGSAGCRGDRRFSHEPPIKCCRDCILDFARGVGRRSPPANEGSAGWCVHDLQFSTVGAISPRDTLSGETHELAQRLSPACPWGGRLGWRRRHCPQPHSLSSLVRSAAGGSLGSPRTPAESESRREIAVSNGIDVSTLD